MFTKKAAEVEIEEIHAAVMALHAEPNSDAIIERAEEEIKELIGVESAFCFMIDTKWNDMYWTQPGAEETSVRFTIGQGIAGWVAENGDPWRANNLAKDPLFVSQIDSPDGGEARNVLSLPLRDTRENTIGVIQVVNKQGSDFTDDDEYYSLIIADHAGIAIDRGREIETSRTLGRSLAAAAARAVDGKHLQTVGHCERVARYAVALGKAFKLSESDIDALEIAAFVHDLGRMEMSPDDGNDPKALDRHRNHVYFTDALLKNVNFPSSMASVPDTAMAHHERLDGSGYPRGLQAAQISLPARILMVANAFDQIYTRGRNNEGRRMTEAQACNKLLEQAGERFDQKVVEAFVKRKLFKIEKRRFSRVEYETPIDVTVLGTDGTEGDAFETDALDISEGGLMFYSQTAIAPMSLIRILIHLPTEKVEALAKVARNLPDKDGKGRRVGAYFLWFDSLE